MSRCCLFLCCTLMGIGLAACTENPPPANAGAGSVAAPAGPRPMLPSAPGGDPVAVAEVPGASGGTGTLRGATPGVTAQAPAPSFNDAPIPPADAEWTILCGAAKGPGHIETIRKFKQDLVEQTKRKEWYLIHGRDESNIYYGFYRTVYDHENKDEAGRAHADLKFIKGMAQKNGDAVFHSAAFVPLGAPDPNSKPEWNLANIDRTKHPKDPERAYWSLQIMAFKDNLQRKAAAVQAVEALRAHYKLDFYYYHGETVSSVCVGAWPMRAIKAQEASGEFTFAGENQTPFVYADRLPEGPGQELLPPGKDDTGRQIVRVAPKLQIDDPTLHEMIKKFPYHELNYEVGKKTLPSGREILDQSFIVMIPRPKGNGYYDSDDTPDSGATLADQLLERRQAQPPRQPRQPGAGQLRGIGER